MSKPLDDLAQLIAVGFSDKVDRQPIGGRATTGTVWHRPVDRW